MGTETYGKYYIFGAIILWKITINMMPVFGAFLVIKIHFKPTAVLYFMLTKRC